MSPPTVKVEAGVLFREIVATGAVEILRGAL